MTANDAWQQVYRAALLEPRPEELRQRIEEAQKAIGERIEQLNQSDDNSCEERQTLADALRNLRVLAETECRVHLSPEIVRPRRGAAS